MSQGETSDKLNEINTQIHGESMDTNNFIFLSSSVHRNRNAAFFIILKHLV